MTRINMSDLNRRVLLVNDIARLPDGYLIYAEAWNGFVRTGVGYGDRAGVKKLGTMKEAYETLWQDRSEYGLVAWAAAIGNARIDGTKFIAGKGWRVRFTKKCVFVTYTTERLETLVSRRFSADTHRFVLAECIMKGDEG